MKSICTWIASFLFIATFAQTDLTLQSNETLQLNYPYYEDLAITIKNYEQVELIISVVNTVSGEQISGFGLAPKGKVTVNIPELCLMQITNPNERKAKIFIEPKSAPIKQPDPEDIFVSFTLRNETSNSIPLLIPGVMNPNLSPYSNSGVRLKIGQEINFRQGLKTHNLIIIDNTIKSGDTLNIGAILQERKSTLEIE